MKAIVGETCEGAWLAAAEYLATASERSEYNLVVEITNPVLHTESDHRVRRVVDDFLRRHSQNPVTTVAGTIFPASDYVRDGARGVYEVYPNETYPEIKSGWGRYAYRIVRWPTNDGDVINPLSVLVNKMKQQLSENGLRMRACYEMSLTDSGIDLPLYDPRCDGKRPRNGPCLSHISMKIGRQDQLHLTALYRSHSYVSKALGNYLGLADLQAFVCDQTGLSPGPLVCVSTYARLETDAGWNIRPVLQLLGDARVASRGEEGTDSDDDG